MTHIPNGKSYIFAIHTNSYTGPFHTDLTAYCTGMLGDGETGKERSYEFFSDLKIQGDDVESPFLGSIQLLPDPNGIYKPSSVWRKHPYVAGISDHLNYKYYTSVAIFFSSLPSPREQQTIFERSAAFAKLYGGNLIIEGYEILEVETRHRAIASWSGIPACVASPTVESFTK
jgi:hypothetical protein